jgi:23S rRNA pseudouridine1911/1915/1917 synthase
MKINKRQVFNMNKITITVTETTAERVDKYVAEKCSISRAQAQQLIQQGAVFVNAVSLKKPSYKVACRDIIELTLPEPDSCDSVMPEPIDIELLYEDDHLVVVNKPAGMVVHPAPGNRDGTVVNALLYHCNKLAQTGAPLRPGVAHRLDKDTSGVLVVAKTDEAYRNLITQFQERQVVKHYRAVVYGHIQQEGRIDLSIGRSRNDRKKMTTRTSHGKEAITIYKPLERYAQATLLDVQIATGRTHQIRVHFAALGHPTLGDSVYGNKLAVKLNGKTFHIPRQMLHAYSLELTHPVSGQRTEFIAPIPQDMADFIQALRGEA